MKKVIFAIAALAAISLTSCKKDYTCECKMSDGTVLSTTTLHAKKSDAKSACSASSTVGTTTITCALK